MANAQPIRVDIIGNARGLSASVDLANAKLSTMTGVAAKASAATDRLQTNMNRINVAMGVAAGVAGAGFVFKNLAQSAGDAQTATRSLEAVFKGSTAQMQEAATAGEQLGLSFTAYGQNATRLGAQLQNMGFDTQGAADATENLLQHAADLSSVYGGSVTQAVEAMSAVFRKELDPIEKYGVTLKAAAIQARADSEGISYGQAAIKAIMEQTGFAVGAFNRNADTYNVQVQKMAAASENAKAKLGAGLLPVFSALTTAVVPVVKGIGALPSPLIATAAAAGIAAGGIKLLSLAAAAGTAKLAAYEAMLVATGRATSFRALFAGIGGAGAFSSLVKGTAAVSVALVGLSYAASQMRASFMAALPTVDELRLRLGVAANSLADIQVTLSRPWYTASPFADMTRDVEELAASLDRNPLEELKRITQVGLAEASNEQDAAKQYFKNVAEGIVAIRDSNPQLAAQRTAELYDVLQRNLGVDEANRMFADFGINVASSAQSVADATTLYADLEEALKGVADAKSYMDSFFGDANAIEKNAAAQKKFAESLGALKEASEGNPLAGFTASQIAAGKASRSTDEKVRGASAALIQFGTDGRDAAIAAGDVAGSSKVAAAATARARTQFIAAAQGAGLQKGAAKALADQLGLIPKDVKTIYKNSGAEEAKRQARDIREEIINIPSYKTVQIVVKRGLAVPGQTGPAFEGGVPESVPQSREVSEYASQVASGTGRGTFYGDGGAIGSAILAGAQAALNKGLKLPANFLKGRSDYKRLFLIDANGVNKKNEKDFKDTVDKVVAYWQTKYEKLYGKLRDLERERAALAKDLAASVTAFSITDQLSGVRDVTSQIADLREQADNATMESWAHLDPIIAAMQQTTDPARFAELRNTYQQLVAAGPRTVADTEKRAALEREIAALQQKESLSAQIQEQVDRTKRFADLLRQLKRQGLSPDQLAEIAKAGPEAGIELAEQLAANEGLRTQWMQAFRAMDTYSKDIGKSIAKYTFAPDISKAESKLKDLWRRSAKQFKNQLQEELDKADLKVKVEVVPVVVSGGGGGFASKSSSKAASAPVIGSLTINGAIDPEGTARSVNRVLRQHATRVGR